MALDVEKKARFESRLAELLKEGDEIAERLPGFELGAFSQENIQVHKWCASIVLLLEGSLDANSLVVEDVRNVLKKAKKPHELFEKMLGVSKAVEECCRVGDLDNRFMRMSKKESEKLDRLLNV